MIIHILPEDFEEAVPGSPFRCLLACALNREMGGHWTVGYGRATLLSGHGVTMVDLPPDAEEAARDFDNKLTVKLKSFELDWPR